MSRSIVKSARRTIEVFRFFNAARSEATVMDFARGLDYPQSSTSELLQSLTAIGYLAYDRRKRTYRPTIQVALLGACAEQSGFCTAGVLPIIDEIAAESGEVVTLAAQVGLEAHYIHVVAAAKPGRPQAPYGGVRSLLHAPAGKLLLSLQPDSTVRALVHRLNASADPDHRVRAVELQSELAQIRRDGQVCGPEGEIEAGCWIGVPLPMPAGRDQPLVIGIAGFNAHVEQDRFRLARILSDTVQRHTRTGTPATPKTGTPKTGTPARTTPAYSPPPRNAAINPATVNASHYPAVGNA